ncbi:hypothetical protein COV93_05960 [Candidatus Woesearchaeota archaeon CG11_big_fil_rev_8_21_14_0_20_43_8]|nr:MAG: hypothetical protein COV93_05960 [Candidatus Woesearchaeota archaeon CG11_big_fil_rev_8_21_14_0_20_43_8]
MPDKDLDNVPDNQDKCPDTIVGHKVNIANGCSCTQLVSSTCSADYSGVSCCASGQGCMESIGTAGNTILQCCDSNECAAGAIFDYTSTTGTTTTTSVNGPESPCGQFSSANPNPTPYEASVIIGKCCPTPVTLLPKNTVTQVSCQDDSACPKGWKCKNAVCVLEAPTTSTFFTGNKIEFTVQCLNIQEDDTYLKNIGGSLGIDYNTYVLDDKDDGEPVVSNTATKYTSCKKFDFPSIRWPYLDASGTLVHKTDLDSDNAYNQGFIRFTESGVSTAKELVDHCASLTEVVEYSCVNGVPAQKIVSCDNMCTYATGNCERSGTDYQHDYLYIAERCDPSGDAFGLKTSVNCNKEEEVINGVCQNDLYCADTEVCDMVNRKCVAGDPNCDNKCSSQFCRQIPATCAGIPGNCGVFLYTFFKDIVAQKTTGYYACTCGDMDGGDNINALGITFGLDPDDNSKARGAIDTCDTVKGTATEYFCDLFSRETKSKEYNCATDTACFEKTGACAYKTDPACVFSKLTTGLFCDWWLCSALCAPDLCQPVGGNDGSTAYACGGCRESDGGDDPYTASTTIGPDSANPSTIVAKEDVCVGGTSGTHTEYYCDSTTKSVTSETTNCKCDSSGKACVLNMPTGGGCWSGPGTYCTSDCDGKCVSPMICSKITNSTNYKCICTDDDGGNYPYTKGTTGGLTKKGTVVTKSDECLGDDLLEYYCVGDKVYYAHYTCGGTSVSGGTIIGYSGCIAGTCTYGDPNVQDFAWEQLSS